ncbi:glycoside hydrolase family 108 protein [Ferrovibrio sp.]|uniref:glycoside hydrolase family 108 protein n=1 Tax=Ferrovibrio sp. TaxID=1917215 RepID=UPI0035B2E3A6
MTDPITEILRAEGGYTDDPADKGNWFKGRLVGTNRGITGETLSAWLGRDVTAEDVRSISEDLAREIYETRYLKKPGIDALPEPPRNCVLDIAVNSGPSRAIKMLQTCLARLGLPCKADGQLGPQTLSLVRSVEAGDLLNTLVDERVRFYKAIVTNDNTQQKYLRGWIKRAESYRAS